MSASTTDETVALKLKALLDEISKETHYATLSIISKEEEIRERCVSLRNKVDAQSEAMLEEIRQWNEEMRNKINEYEKECLEKFNAGAFEASASILKSLVAEITSQQEKIEQQIEEARSNEEKINELINDTSNKLHSLKKQNLIVRKQKFGQRDLELTIASQKRADLGRILTLTSLDTLGFDKLSYLDTVRDMPDFHQLCNCFINPYAESPELIAVTSNQSGKINKLGLVKMDSSGKVLKSTSTDSYGDNVQTFKDYFIVCTGFGFKTKLERFDYDLNELEVSERYGFKPEYTANQRFIIRSLIDEENPRGPLHFYKCSHDLSKSTLLSDDIGVDYIYRMLATDKYLYIWYRERICIVDIKSCQLFHEGNEERYNDPDLSFLGEKPFTNNFDQVKMLGQERIVTFHKQTATLRVYTADDQVELIKECKINLRGNIEDYQMSTDCSNGVCLFSCQGDIYHNMI